MDRFETVFFDDLHPENAAHSAPEMSGPLREHVYWGSMRDRLAATQTDRSVGANSHDSDGWKAPIGEQHINKE